MKYSIAELRSKLIQLWSQCHDVENAQRITEYLIWAETSGNHTQGVIKLTGSDPMHRIVPQGPMRVERDTKLSQLIDGAAQPAPLVSQIATDVVIEKCRASGFGIVSAHNTFSSNGAQAFYAERIAKNDFIGIVLSRSPGSTTGFNSIDPIFGTNPIGIAFPTLEEPLVFDMATSAMTYYGLVLAKARGEGIPAGIAIDADGNPTTDPSAAMKGAILPFDGSYKSSSIGLAVEILAGPLASSAFCDFKTFDKEWGSTFIALDPELLVNRMDFKKSCSELISIIRSSRPKIDGESIRLPGDRSREARREAERTGVVDIDEVILKELGFI